jgi:hypothetical protein
MLSNVYFGIRCVEYLLRGELWSKLEASALYC